MDKTTEAKPTGTTETPAPAAQKPAAPSAAKPTEKAPATAAPQKPAQEAKPAAPAAPSKSERWQQTLGSQQKLLEVEGKLKELGPKAQKLEEIVAKAKEDPIAALELLGLDYGTVARAQVKRAAGGAQDPAKPTAKPTETSDDPVQKRLKEVEAKFEQFATEEQKAQEAETERQWKEYAAGVETAVTSDAKSYPLINLFGAAGLVVDEIASHFAKTQKVITAQEAAKAMEERFKADVQKLRTEKPELAQQLRQLLSDPEEAKPETKAPPRAPSGKTRTPPMRSLQGAGTAPALAPATGAADKVPIRPPSRGEKRGGFFEWRQQKRAGQAAE